MDDIFSDKVNDYFAKQFLPSFGGKIDGFETTFFDDGKTLTNIDFFTESIVQDFRTMFINAIVDIDFAAWKTSKAPLEPHLQDFDQLPETWTDDTSVIRSILVDGFVKKGCRLSSMNYSELRKAGSLDHVYLGYEQLLSRMEERFQLKAIHWENVLWNFIDRRYPSALQEAADKSDTRVKVFIKYLIYSALALPRFEIEICAQKDNNSLNAAKILAGKDNLKGVLAGDNVMFETNGRNFTEKCRAFRKGVLTNDIRLV